MSAGWWFRAARLMPVRLAVVVAVVVGAGAGGAVYAAEDGGSATSAVDACYRLGTGMV